MNLILFDNNDLVSPCRIKLSDHRFRHILEIHGSQPGDTVRVGKRNGPIGRGIITSLDAGSVVIDFELTDTPPAKLPLTMILALPRPKMLRRIIRSVAELGVSELILVNSYKVEKSYWSSPLLADQAVEQSLIEGLQQSRDTVLPTVRMAKRFKPFVEDQLPELCNKKIALLAEPGSNAYCPQPLDQPAIIAIGPEGGFIPYEVEKFIQAGFKSISLGPRILKVESAVTSLTAKLYSSNFT